jgi:hypothetical protein
MSSVPAVLNSRWAGLSVIDAFPGFDRSTARSCVEILLITSTTGAFSLSSHATCNIAAPETGSRAIAALPLLVHWLPVDLDQSLSLTEGSGIQAWVLPAASVISILVVISKLRHLPGCGANLTSPKASRGSAAAKATLALVFRKSRLSKRIIGLRCMRA